MPTKVRSKRGVAKKYLCDRCGVIFNQWSNLFQHYQRKHTTDEEQQRVETKKPDKKFECDICHKLFISPYSLKYHILQFHTDEKKYQCNDCGRRMAKKFMLIQHMKCHFPGQFSCVHCERKFTRKYDMEDHVKTKHMMRYTCVNCNDCFATPMALKYHELIHKVEPPADKEYDACMGQTSLDNYPISYLEFTVDNETMDTFDLCDVLSDQATQSDTLVTFNGGPNLCYLGPTTTYVILENA